MRLIVLPRQFLELAPTPTKSYLNFKCPRALARETTVCVPSMFACKGKGSDVYKLRL